MPNDGVDGWNSKQYPDNMKQGLTKLPVNNTGHNEGLVEEIGDISVSLSTTFFPTANLNGDIPPDLLLLTSDSVFFYVHSSKLLDASNNRFGSIIPPFPSQADGHPMTAHVGHSSVIMNLILHAVYRMSCMQFVPSFHDVFSSICSLPHLGLQVGEYVFPDSPLFEAAMSHAPTVPLEVYALAARFDLYQLASAASSHILSIPISSITDELANRIGPLYLKKIVCLHMDRTEKLKQLLLTPPSPHPSTPACNSELLNRAWSFGTASLAWEVRPDLSTAMIKSALKKGEAQLSCPLCQQWFRRCMDDIVDKWLHEKRAI